MCVPFPPLVTGIETADAVSFIARYSFTSLSACDSYPLNREWIGRLMDGIASRSLSSTGNLSK